jgi:uroporphyrinogen decarboxylase
LFSIIKGNIPGGLTDMSTILIDTLKGDSTSRPPFWFMRQAGRVLPSYLAIKEKYSFWEMMQDPKIGAQVTLLPVNDLGVDAAILFSDILVVPYAMGMGLDFTERGPVFEEPLFARKNPVGDLNPDPGRLDYIYHVIDQVKNDSQVPLIGFSGAPLTVLCYMLQGLGRNPDFPEAVKFFYRNKQATQKLVDAVTGMTLEYIRGQIEHGIDVFQLFETHAGLVPLEAYEELFMPAIKKIAAYVRDRNIPFLFFPKGFGAGYKKITPEVCDYVSIDWQTPLEMARGMIHKDIGLQGNLDPRVLYADKKTIEERLSAYLRFGQQNQNWIFNLGHGFLPGIPYENAVFMADWLRNTNWDR